MLPSHSSWWRPLTAVVPVAAVAAPLLLLLLRMVEARRRARRSRAAARPGRRRRRRRLATRRSRAAALLLLLLMLVVVQSLWLPFFVGRPCLTVETVQFRNETERSEVTGGLYQCECIYIQIYTCYQTICDTIHVHKACVSALFRHWTWQVTPCFHCLPLKHPGCASNQVHSSYAYFLYPKTLY